MAQARISLMALNNVYPSLFSKLKVPDKIDREALINNIILQSGEFEVLYPNPEFMKEAIGLWSIKHQKTFEKLLEAINAEFSPIENVDRYEDITDITDSNNTVNYGLVNELKNDSNVTTSGKVINTDKKSAYDSNAYEPDAESTTSYDGYKQQNGGTVKSSNSGNDKNTGHNEVKHTAHIHGNIGVTESTTLTAHFIDFYDAYNLYEHITNLFMDEFIIRVF